MARVTWLRPDEAALWLRTTRGNVHVLAHRHGWRRQGSGRTLRYSLDDINDTLDRRLDPPPDVSHDELSSHP